MFTAPSDTLPGGDGSNMKMGDEYAVTLPTDLVQHQEKVQEYLQETIVKLFGPALLRRLEVQLPPDDLNRIILETFQSLPQPQLSVTEPLDCHLLFRHECLALGCRDAECTLCQYNPGRLCERNFGKKYLVSDALKAKCGASIKIELTDGIGQRMEDELAGVQFEVYLIDGVVFKEKGGEGRVLSEADLRACIRSTNHKDEALLQYKSSGAHSPQQKKILLKLEKGQVLLPDLMVTDSSEALLTGRKPPFRLLVMGVKESLAGGEAHMVPGIHYAVSEEFVVATRRVKQANKADIPLVDDHVSKIEHVGRETVKKLQNLKLAATEIGVELVMPEGLTNVTTVGQFRMLVELADKDVQMRKILQIVLKLSKEKWEEAATHAMMAVVPDFRQRVWYPPGHNMGIGLLFNCKYAAVQLKEPVALVQVNSQSNVVKVVPEDQLDPSSLNIVRQLKSQAVQSWWTPRHPGWGVFRSAEAASPSSAVKPLAMTPSLPSIKPESKPSFKFATPPPPGVSPASVNVPMSVNQQAQTLMLTQGGNMIQQPNQQSLLEGVSQHHAADLGMDPAGVSQHLQAADVSMPMDTSHIAHQAGPSSSPPSSSGPSSSHMPQGAVVYYAVPRTQWQGGANSNTGRSENTTPDGSGAGMQPHTAQKPDGMAGVPGSAAPAAGSVWMNPDGTFSHSGMQQPGQQQAAA